MAELFEELGLRPELVAAARDRGYMGPTALQRSAIPVLRRRGNALLHASAGAGTMAAYGLAVLDHLAAGGDEDGGEDQGVRALVVVPTEDDAALAASSLAWFGRAVGVRVTALAAGWAGTKVAGVDIVVGSPSAFASAIEGSRLKLEGVEAIVVDGASAILSLGGGEALEMLVSLVPRDAQRVVVTAELGGEVDGFVERHLRRALRFPPVPHEVPGAFVEEQPVRRLEYQVVAESEKLRATSTLISAAEPGRLPVVYARTPARSEEVAAELSLRGHATRSPAEGAEGEIEGVVVSSEVVEAPADALVVSYDVPFDAETLVARHERGGTVLVTPRELEHLKTIAKREGFELRGVSATPARDESLAGFRAQLKSALETEDLGAQLLVLEPLFREYSPAEVAAAASALLRRKLPVERGRSEPAAGRAAAAPVAPAPSPAYVRLFVGVGERDGIVPSDLVGAITGEAQVKGSQIGRIEIRDTFSIVEVENDIATRVIQAVNGITLKDRSVRVDFDRRGATPRRGGPDRPRRRIVPRDRPR